MRSNLASAWLADDLLLFAQNRGETRDLSAKCCPDMLRGIRYEVLDAAHDLCQECAALHEAAEAGYLASNRCADLSLVVLQELDEGRYKISGDNLVVYSLGNL